MTSQVDSDRDYEEAREEWLQARKAWTNQTENLELQQANLNKLQAKVTDYVTSNEYDSTRLRELKQSAAEAKASVDKAQESLDKAKESMKEAQVRKDSAKTAKDSGKDSAKAAAQSVGAPPPATYARGVSAAETGNLISSDNNRTSPGQTSGWSWIPDLSSFKQKIMVSFGFGMVDAPGAAGHKQDTVGHPLTAGLDRVDPVLYRLGIEAKSNLRHRQGRLPIVEEG